VTVVTFRIGPHSEESDLQNTRSALFVTTVPVTLQLFLSPFSDHFRAEGWRVDALCNGASTDERLAVHFDHRYDVAWSRNPFAPRNLLGTSRRVRAIVEETGYDIVHVHTPIAAFVTRWSLRARRPGRPIVIYTAHGFHFYAGGSPTGNAIFNATERLAAGWTDYLVTINREDFEAARTFSRIDPSRVRLIPGIGVDLDRFAENAVLRADAAAVRSTLRIPDDAFMVTMIAEFAPVKRHAFALDALAKVTNKRVVLALVGDGPLEDDLHARVRRLGLADRVRFAGYRRDIPAVLAASDALLLCSEREGLNRSVLEAMASGVPVIGTDTRGIADAVGGPDAGWIVDKNDSAALAAAIDEAASNPSETARRGAVARTRARDEFALPRIIDAYEELYGEAIASRV
jgi:glycosyltransferase involved in cell wall biosynthesis